MPLVSEFVMSNCLVWRKAMASCNRVFARFGGHVHDKSSNDG